MIGLVPRFNEIQRRLDRLDVFDITALTTLAASFLSTIVAATIVVVMDMPNIGDHLLVSFVVPYFITPLFGLLTAFSLRKLHRAHRIAADLARKDPLTGLLNRRSFFHPPKIEALSPDGSLTSRVAFFIDIDNFKSINDRYGHDAGDAVLRHFANQLRGTVRDRDLAGRIGGEEFALHIVNIDAKRAIDLMEMLVDTIRDSSLSHGEHEIRYTISIGAVMADPSMTIEELLRSADRQLYAAKESGRDGWEFTDLRTGETATSRSRQDLADLADAIARSIA